MILTGKKITEEYEKGRITITPFDPENVTTNSVDLTLGRIFRKYTCKILDPRKNNPYKEFEVDPEKGLYLRKGAFVLGHSEEIIGSDFYVPEISGRSSVGRLGIFVRLDAGLFDLGAHLKATFMIYATLPVRIYPGEKMGQVTFWKPYGKITLYDGKYQGSEGPRTSEMYRDFH